MRTQIAPEQQNLRLRPNRRPSRLEQPRNWQYRPQLHGVDRQETHTAQGSCLLPLRCAPKLFEAITHYLDIDTFSAGREYVGNSSSGRANIHIAQRADELDPFAPEYDLITCTSRESGQ